MPDIEPVVRPQEPIIITSVEIGVIGVVLGVSASVEVRMLDDEKRIRDIVVLSLQQPDYGNWGSDDQYVVNWSMTQLGLIPK